MAAQVVKTRDLLKASSTVLLSYARALSVSGTTSTDVATQQTLPLTEQATSVTSDHILSDLSALLPSLRHDLTALSLALSLDELAAGKDETWAGARTIIAGVQGKAEKIMMASGLWKVEWGKWKGKELRWEGVEVLEAVGKLLEGLDALVATVDCSRPLQSQKNYTSSTSATKQREAVLQATATAWSAIDNAASKVERSERVCLKVAWTEMRKTVEDALSEAADLAEDSPSGNAAPDEVDRIFGAASGQTLGVAELARVQATLPLLKLLKLLLFKLASSVVGPAGGLGSLLGSLSVSALDKLAKTTEDLVASSDDLVIALSADFDDASQDVEGVKEITSQLRKDVEAVVKTLSDATGVEQVTAGVNGLDLGTKDHGQHADVGKEVEWIGVWGVQFGKAADKLLGIS